MKLCRINSHKFLETKRKLTSVCYGLPKMVKYGLAYVYRDVIQQITARRENTPTYSLQNNPESDELDLKAAYTINKASISRWQSDAYVM